MIEIKEIAKNSTQTTEISKSKFIAYSFVVHTEEDVKVALDGLQKKYTDATHICYAYSICGKEKAVDDGEPQNTAGKPILDCIKKAGYQNVLVVVVRYFGGIKLGVGGLVRAYSNSASSILAMSGPKVSVACKKVSFDIDISQSKYVEKIKQIDLIKKIEITYGQNVSVQFYCLSEDVEKIINQIKNILNTETDFNISNDIFYV